jgi:predicted kinase
VSGPGLATEAWLRDVFDSDVRGDLFAAHNPPPGQPVLVLLGGQPAAGKTRAQDAILAERPGLVPITGDDLRAYHPDYDRLTVEDPLGMPAATAPVSGGLVRLALDHALAGGYSALLEGTFRDPAMVAATAERFAAAGYRVEVVAIATPPPVSRLGAEQRFLGAAAPRAARWTPPEAHEAATTRAPATVAALEASPAVTRIQVRSRDHILHDNTRLANDAWPDGPGAAAALQAEQARQLNPAQASAWLAAYTWVFEAARSRPGYLNQRTIPAYRRLQEDAETLITIVAANDPSSDTETLRHAHRRQAIILETAALAS